MVAFEYFGILIIQPLIFNLQDDTLSKKLIKKRKALGF